MASLGIEPIATMPVRSVSADKGGIVPAPSPRNLDPNAQNKGGKKGRPPGSKNRPKTSPPEDVPTGVPGSAPVEIPEVPVAVPAKPDIIADRVPVIVAEPRDEIIIEPPIQHDPTPAPVVGVSGGGSMNPIPWRLF